ncbi:MAG TPA: hypothetical protein PLP88_14190, partial [Bacteroidales bacterium]|nr:hypothetical protein [Bacteroidales bacterium]
MQKKSEGQQKFDQFRHEFDYFEYVGYQAGIVDSGIRVIYNFNLAGKYSFHPTFNIPARKFYTKPFDAALLNAPEMQYLLFNIGMIELISYWKAACPKKVIVKNQSLNPQQIAWWKKVYYNGLGEFFYTNEISCTLEDFMEIESQGPVAEKFELKPSGDVIVPVGGGKDSIVTLEMLRNEFRVRPFIMNPRGATLETVFTARFGRHEIIEVNRSIDLELLRLNEQGFLNGHTPFSAMLAFYSLLVSWLSGIGNIALSNESSANESTVAGSTVNHQYSKSFEFEKDFREYVSDWLSDGFNYFSFLRPLNELQIAGLFADHVRYYPVFKSCNVGSKTDVWCGNCAKCLFAWIILSPFIPLDELIHIFGKNLYEDASLIGYLKQLTGIDDVKPFECVGTIDEVNAALVMFIRRQQGKWALLTDYYSNTVKYNEYRLFQFSYVL